MTYKSLSSRRLAALIFALCSLASLTLASTAEKKPEVPVKFGVIREDCFDKFTNFDFFSDTSCIGFTIGKSIGYAIVGGSAILKVP